MYLQKYKTCQVQNYGHDEFKCLPKDCRNFIHQNRKLLHNKGILHNKGMPNHCIYFFFNEMQSKG